MIFWRFWKNLKYLKFWNFFKNPIYYWRVVENLIFGPSRISVGPPNQKLCSIEGFSKNPKINQDGGRIFKKFHLCTTSMIKMHLNHGQKLDWNHFSKSSKCTQIWCDFALWCLALSVITSVGRAQPTLLTRPKKS